MIERNGQMMFDNDDLWGCVTDFERAIDLICHRLMRQELQIDGAARQTVLVGCRRTAELIENVNRALLEADRLRRERQMEMELCA